MPNAEMRRSAKQARLQYGSDRRPGIYRHLEHGRPVYVDRRHKRIRDRAVLARIRSLAIPPAWTNVWISADANSHLQATGRDAKGRKQYRVIAFAKVLPKIRARVK